jgi:hypothetical protein
MNLLGVDEMRALESLDSMLRRWNVEYVLVDAYALRLQGYDVKKGGHINTLVDSSTIPWPVENPHEAFPPRGSVYFEEYRRFVEAESPLHMIPYSPDQLDELPTIRYYLPNRNPIRVGKPSESTSLFAAEIKQYSIQDIGGEKIRDWLDKIEHWRVVAEGCDDHVFAESCMQAVMEVKAHFGFQ